MRKFNLRLSRQLDAIHHELENIKTQPKTPIKARKLAILKAKLRQLEKKL